MTKGNSLDKQYQALLQDIIDNGVKKEDRTGTGTISVFGRQIRHNMSEGFPLLTTKKMPFKTIVTELLWFLQGNTNIKYLVDNNCHIWDGDAFKNYVNTYKGNFPMDKEEFIETIKTNDEFAERWGELGPIYGKQWRNWKTFFTQKEGIDQISRLIYELTNNPDSRRLMVNAWNVGEIDQMVLPPCHYGFQVYTRELSFEERFELLKKLDLVKEARYKNVPSEKITNLSDSYNIPTRAISLMWNQRSCDFPLGIPFNIASYGLLLMMIADEVNMVPEELIGNLGDCHIYLNQIKGCKEQIKREPKKLPTVHVRDGIYCSSHSDVLLFDYEAHPAIKFPLSN